MPHALPPFYARRADLVYGVVNCRSHVIDICSSSLEKGALITRADDREHPDLARPHKKLSQQAQPIFAEDLMKHGTCFMMPQPQCRPRPSSPVSASPERGKRKKFLDPKPDFCRSPPVSTSPHTSVFVRLLLRSVTLPPPPPVGTYRANQNQKSSPIILRVQMAQLATW